MIYQRRFPKDECLPSVVEASSSILKSWIFAYEEILNGNFGILFESRIGISDLSESFYYPQKWKFQCVFKGWFSETKYYTTSFTFTLLTQTWIFFLFPNKIDFRLCRFHIRTPNAIWVICYEDKLSRESANMCLHHQTVVAIDVIVSTPLFG